MDIINPFSVILLALILCILMLKTEKKRYILLLTLTILIEMLYLRGYFIVLGVSQMPYSWFMELVMFVYAIIIMLKGNYKVAGTLFVFTLLFLFFSCLSIYYFQFFPIDNEVIYNVSDWDLYINGYANKVKPEVVFSRVIFIMVPILSFFFNMMLAYVYVTKEDVAYIVRYICLTGKCYIGCIALECLAKNLFQVEIFGLFYFILGTGVNTFGGINYRGNFVALQGFSAETSWLALSLYLFSVFFLINGFYNKGKISFNDIKWVFISVVLMFLSGSFTTVMYFSLLLIFIIYMFFYKRHINTKYVLFAMVVVLIFISYMVYQFLITESFIQSRLMSLFSDIIPAIASGKLEYRGIIDAEGSFSTLSRLVSICSSFTNFFASPFIGIGIGVQSSHGAFVNALSDFGIIGIFIWWKIITRVNRKFNKIFALLIIVPSLFFGGREFLLFSIYIIVMIFAFSLCDS